MASKFEFDDQKEQEAPKTFASAQNTAAGTSLGGFSKPGATQQEKSSGLFTDASKYLKANEGAGMRMATGIRDRFNTRIADEKKAQDDASGKWKADEEDYKKRLDEWNRAAGMGGGARFDAQLFYRDQLPWTGTQTDINAMRDRYKAFPCAPVIALYLSLIALISV